MIQNINELVQQEIKNVDVNAIFQEELKKQVSESVKRVMKDAVGPYSDFTKSLEKHVKETMGFDPSKMKIPEYSNFVVEQTCEVLKDLMSAERAKNMKTQIIEKLAPNLTKEMSLDSLVDKLSSILMESYDEDDSSSTAPKFTIYSTQKRTYSFSQEYWDIVVKEGDSEIAKLHTDASGNCYHSTGDKRSPIAKLFSAFVFNRTVITDMEVVNKEISIEDKY